MRLAVEVEWRLARKPQHFVVESDVGVFGTE
jgi:hypothetical protein